MIIEWQKDYFARTRMAAAMDAANGTAPIVYRGQEMTITFGSRSATVQAQVCGHFAIHPTIDGDGFTVTHLPTQRYLRCNVTREQAESCVALALSITDLDWSRTDVDYYNQPWQRIKRAVLDPHYRW